MNLVMDYREMVVIDTWNHNIKGKISLFKPAMEPANLHVENTPLFERSPIVLNADTIDVSPTSQCIFYLLKSPTQRKFEIEIYSNDLRKKLLQVRINSQFSDMNILKAIKLSKGVLLIDNLGFTKYILINGNLKEKIQNSDTEVVELDQISSSCESRIPFEEYENCELAELALYYDGKAGILHLIHQTKLEVLEHFDIKITENNSITGKNKAFGLEMKFTNFKKSRNFNYQSKELSPCLTIELLQKGQGINVVRKLIHNQIFINENSQINPFEKHFDFENFTAETSSMALTLNIALKAGVTREFATYSYKKLFGIPSLLIQDLDLTHDSYEDRITMFVTFDEFISKVVIQGNEKLRDEPEVYLLQLSATDLQSEMSEQSSLRDFSRNICLGRVFILGQGELCVFEEVNQVLLVIRLDLILDKIEILSTLKIPSSLLNQREYSLNQHFHHLCGFKSDTFLVTNLPSEDSLHGGYTQLIHLEERKLVRGQKMNGFLLPKMQLEHSRMESLGGNKILKPAKYAYFSCNSDTTIVEMSLYSDLKSLMEQAKCIEKAELKFTREVGDKFRALLGNEEVKYFGLRTDQNGQNLVDFYRGCRALVFSIDSQSETMERLQHFDQRLSICKHFTPILGPDFIALSFQGKTTSCGKLLVLETLSLKTVAEIDFDSFTSPTTSINVDHLENISMLSLQNGELKLIKVRNYSPGTINLGTNILKKGSILVHHSLEKDNKLSIIFLEESKPDQKVTLYQQQLNMDHLSQKETKFTFELGSNLQKVESAWRGKGFNNEDIGVWNIHLKKSSYELRYLGEGKINLQKR